MNHNELGTVYLVGAGPGDPELLTVKAKRLLTECDALIYDSLIPTELLELIPETSERHFVGKRRGHHSLPQSKTNDILLEMSKKHSCIVRLKGGDPFLFGRGAEEAAYLSSHGVPCEVVPGITSGIAVPAYSGIPVTHRSAGSSVTFVTGHESAHKINPSVNWRALASATDGLVIYMGVYNLKYIVSELISGGIDPNTPAAVIQQGTVVGQRFIKSSVCQIVEKVNKYDLASPAIVLIGSTIDFQVEDCSPALAKVTMPTLG
tara:strand:+ start:288 stop:1073 length:786 start_codon:yes stop_codon:yes gene_type:complete